MKHRTPHPLRERLVFLGALVWFLVRNGALLEIGALCALAGLRALAAGHWLLVLLAALGVVVIVQTVAAHAAQYEAWVFQRIRQRSIPPPPTPRQVNKRQSHWQRRLSFVLRRSPGANRHSLFTMEEEQSNAHQ
jgi:hypothetical protein